MEKRIDELCKEVYGVQLSNDCELDDKNRNFAELIIKECARIASHFSIENKRFHPDIDPRNMNQLNQMVYHSTCQSIAREIREQFGIDYYV